MTTARIQVGKLLAGKLLRRIEVPEQQPEQALTFKEARRKHQKRKQYLLELTSDGRRAVAGQHALASAAPAARPPARRSRKGRLLHRMFHQFSHTRGAIEVFLGLLRQAAERRKFGRDDALLEWRSEIDCVTGLVNPDGYGVCQRAGRKYGFFLEFDRGTETKAQLYRKLERYYEYRDKGAYEQDFVGFPTILVITVRNGTERRIAEVARALAAGRGSSLPLLLTCQWRLDNDPEGLLGEVWQKPSEAGKRVAWLGGTSSVADPSRHSIEPPRRLFLA